MHRKQRVGTGRPRRGATLVFVAVFALALVALAAFAIDLSRLYVGTNELQTGADAAALRGALQLQYNPGQSPVTVTTTFATSNQALNQPVALANADVTPVLWDPAGNPKATILNAWTNANAVQVSASRSTGLLFGRLLSAVSPTPQRKSIAWVANVNRVSCPTPWGFPVISLNEHLYPAGGTTNYSVSPSMFADLDAKLKAINGRQEMTMIFWPPTQLSNGGPQLPKQTGSDSAFYALADNMNAYADQIANPNGNCENQSIAVGQSESFPGQGGGTVQKKTVDGVEGTPPADGPGFCSRPAGSADCWPRGTASFIGQTPGVTVTVAWVGAIVGSNVPVRSIGGFRVLCVYPASNGGGGGGKKDDDDDKKNNGNGNGNGGGSAARCEWLDGTNKAFFTAKGVSTPYDEGTIVGYPVTTYPGLGEGVVLGNAPALGQRLIIVR